MMVGSVKRSFGAGVAALLLCAACSAHVRTGQSPGAPRHGGAQEQEQTVTVSTSCGFLLNPPAFSGWVVYQGPTGILTPVPDARFEQGIGEESLLDGLLEEVAIPVDPNGYFSAPVSISTSTTVWKDGDTILSTDDWVEDVVFRVSAHGCEPALLHFSMEWSARDVVLRCPGRTNGMRAGG